MAIQSSTQGGSNYEDDDGPFHEPFDFINKDLDLLFLLIFIEAFKSGKEELNFSEFFKGNYWDIEQVSDEIRDTNDYSSVPDMVISQALFVFEDMRMGDVIEVGIDDTDEAVKDLLIEVAKIGPEDAKKEAPYFFQSVEQLFFLSHQRKQEVEALLEKNPEMYKNGNLWRDKSVFYTKKQDYFRILQTLIIDATNHIIIRVKYHKGRVKKIEKEIATYLDAFSKDQYINESPLYQEKRLYFSRQVENFYRYISRLNLIGDTVNVPFTILNENGFEAVKLLHFLQIKGVINMRWSDEGSWKVQFTKIPVTPESLLGSTKPNQANSSLKHGLSFNEATSMLVVGEYSVKINGPDQKEFLKIIFKDPKELGKQWFFSEIAEQYDRMLDAKDKKFYNASYQVNLKVAQKTPIEDFLITTKQSAQVNPIYL